MNLPHRENTFVGHLIAELAGVIECVPQRNGFVAH